MGVDQYQILETKIFNFGGKDLVQKIVDLAAMDFKRKNRNLMGGEDLNKRSKRKLTLQSAKTMQTLRKNYAKIRSFYSLQKSKKI